MTLEAGNSHTPSPEISDELRPQGITAIELREKLLFMKHPEVTQIVLASYSFVDEKHTQTDTTRIVDIPQKTHPGFENLVANSEDSRIGAMCAISSIVGTNLAPSRLLDTSADWFPGIENPRAIVQLDLSCQIDPGNLTRIITVLRNYHSTWYVLETAKSYHLILDRIVFPEQLAWYWGDLLGRFTPESRLEGPTTENRRLATLLKETSFNPIALRNGPIAYLSRVLRRVQETVGYDGFSGHSYVDWGYLGFSLADLVDCMNGKKYGAAFLRLGHKGESGPPVVVAQSE